MSRPRLVPTWFLPLRLLIAMLVSLTLLLVGAVLWLAPVGHPRSLQIAQFVAAAWLSVTVTALAVHRFVVEPLRVALHVILRVTEGDFTVRAQVEGRGLVTQVLWALDDMVGILEARWATAQASERRYRSLFEHSPASLFRTRRDGRVLECNPAAVRMLGYDSILDLKTRNVRTHYRDPREWDRVVERLAQETAIRNLRVRLHRKDGNEIPVLLTMARAQEAGEICFDGQLLDASELGLIGQNGCETRTGDPEAHGLGPPAGKGPPA